MSFHTYNEYKNTGVEWLGKLPAHWDVFPLKAGFNLMKRSPPEDCGVVTAFRDGEVTLRSNRRMDGFTEAFQEIGYQGVEPNDLVIHAMDAFAGAIGVSDSKGKSTPVYSVCEPKKDYFSRYYGLVLRHIALAGFIQSLAKGIRERSTDFRWSDAKNIPVPHPSIEEQKTIIDFLDYEAGKIDRLVAEQVTLIELLKEKRQAVISHTMSKGLDPKVKMKDSGVEWLGEIPEHWKIYRVKKLLSVLTDYTANGSFASLAENVTYQDSGYSRLVRLTDLRENLENDGLYVDESAHNFLKKSELRGGEVLIANVGAYAGFACLMPRIDMKATLGPNMYLMKFKESLLSNEFALLMLMSFHAQEQLKLSATSTAQPKLNKDDVKEIWLALPADLSEQDQILNYVNSQKHSFDSLIEQAKLGIQLLQERRSALISAAVTGQIDVRNYQSKEVS